MEICDFDQILNFIPVRGQRAESKSCQLDIVQEAPGGVASVEIEDVGVTILPLALDGVVAGEERVHLESSASKCY